MGAPDEERIYDFEKIEMIMNRIGYQLVDLHEHEFQKGNLSVEFGSMNTWKTLLGFLLDELVKHETAGVIYFLLMLNNILRFTQHLRKIPIEMTKIMIRILLKLLIWKKC